MVVLVVDGMNVEGPIEVPGLPTTGPRGPCWQLTLERGDPADALDAVVWTGDVRSHLGRWARMGRRGAERIVLIEGVAALRARPRDGTAVLRHDGGKRRDAAVLRRLAPYLASLRGRLVLHAAAAVFPAGAVLLCGEARAGKSTLALALDRLGVAVLGDDHVAVEVSARGGPRAYPSFPFIDVDGPARRVVGGLRGARRPEEGRPGKESVPLGTARPSEPVPVVAVAFVHRGKRVSLTPLRPAVALAKLLNEAVFFPDPADRRDPPRFLDACLKLLEAAPPVGLTVPSGLVRLSRTVEELTDLWRRRDL